jgi:hypothetical protein
LRRKKRDYDKASWKRAGFFVSGQKKKNGQPKIPRQEGRDQAFDERRSYKIRTAIRKRTTMSQINANPSIRDPLLSFFRFTLTNDRR